VGRATQKLAGPRRLLLTHVMMRCSRAPRAEEQLAALGPDFASIQALFMYCRCVQRFDTVFCSHTQAQLPEIRELSEQLRKAYEEMSDADFKAAEAAAAAETREAALTVRSVDAP